MAIVENCPMCGQSLAEASGECPRCGETFGPPSEEVLCQDRPTAEAKMIRVTWALFAAFATIIAAQIGWELYLGSTFRNWPDLQKVGEIGLLVGAATLFLYSSRRMAGGHRADAWYGMVAWLLAGVATALMWYRSPATGLLVFLQVSLLPLVFPQVWRVSRSQSIFAHREHSKSDSA